MSEFGEEMQNFIAYRVTEYDKLGNAVTRNRLTNHGPDCVRGDPTVMKDIRLRWIQALLDAGIIEPDWETARKFSKPRADNEASRYKVRAEVFQKFSDPLVRAMLSEHYRRSRDMEESGPPEGVTL